MNFKINGVGHLLITCNLAEIFLCRSYSDQNRQEVNIYFLFVIIEDVKPILLLTKMDTETSILIFMPRLKSSE